MESREELPHNIMEVFHKDVSHEVDPRVEIVIINIETGIVGIIHRPKGFNIDDDMDIEESMNIVVPYTHIQVPIVNSDTISPKDVSEAVNLFPEDITLRKMHDYINPLEDDENYIVVHIDSRPPIGMLLGALLGSLLD